jgi:hypothetical protein
MLRLLIIGYNINIETLGGYRIMNNSTFSIYEIDNNIEKLEEIIDSFSVELELLYFERGMFGGILSQEHQDKLEKYENIILEKSCELDLLYFHRHLLQNKRKYLY